VRPLAGPETATVVALSLSVPVATTDPFTEIDQLPGPPELLLTVAFSVAEVVLTFVAPVAVAVGAGQYAGVPTVQMPAAEALPTETRTSAIVAPIRASALFMCSSLKWG
jgi:hypothetical protein